MKATKEQKLLLFVLILLLLEGVFFSLSKYQINKKEEIENEIILNEKKLINQKLSNLQMEAKAVSIYDLDKNEFIYGKNDTIPMPLASLVKTMTVLIATQNNFDKIIISKESINQAEDNGLYAGEIWNINDLAKFSLIASSNDGAYALSEGIDNFIFKMNEEAKKIGMEHTIFYNQTGLDIDDKNAGAYGNANDMNTLAVFAYRFNKSLFEATQNKELNFNITSGNKIFSHTAQNTNNLIGKIPNILFSKTGHTELAGGNLTIIWENNKGKQYAITVLGSSVDGRFSDMEKIISVL
ncbi:MAG: hypothetical protein NTZ44_03840 [Candidatus Nomurabacteria bacterium]|nr:hypothetical protein [Candidatus Nomurabacteria bacterium]